MKSINHDKKKGDILFNLVNYTVLTLAFLIVAYPLYFVIIASVSQPEFLNTGDVWIWPKGFNIDGYKRIFQTKSIWIGYRNTIIYTSFGTALNVLLTLTAAYPLSIKKFFVRNYFMIFLIITMFFSGGLIPLYILVKNLGLLNKMAVLIIVNAAAVWHIIIARTFMQNIPNALRDAAVIDGCSHINYFVRVVVPLSKALIAILILFYGVAHWNDFFNALIFLRDETLFPLQLVLRKILLEAQMEETVYDVFVTAERAKITESIRYGVILIASLPLIVMYPFLQKYFAKGVMIGSVKG